uniref:VWFA domain-containing protein n=1 Tax=Buteo japonicus TaxID=224669 RepID=A0A8B9ZCR6_9AVES
MLLLKLSGTCAFSSIAVGYNLFENVYKSESNQQPGRQGIHLVQESKSHTVAPLCSNLTLSTQFPHFLQPRNCPINVYFIIDTSESVALQTVPIQSLVDQIKQFIPMFINKLESELYQSQVYITWQFGGLHYSDVVEIYSPLTSSKDIYLTRLLAINYLGRGTFTDCAISNMTEQIQTQMASGVNFAIVITDGHVTGSPCGGMKVQAERARDMGIKLFAVAPSENVYEQGLREIANLPHELYRNNYAITQKDTLEIDENTIDRIIQAMVRTCTSPDGPRKASPHDLA